MKDALSGFRLDDYPEVDFDYTGWKDSFHPTEACNDSEYLKEHVEEALNYIQGNLNVGNYIITTAIELTNELNSLGLCTPFLKIPNDVSEFALRIGGEERAEILHYLNHTEELPSPDFIPLLKEIIEQALENKLEDSFDYRMTQAVRVLSRYKKTEITRYIEDLSKNKLVTPETYVQDEVKRVLEESSHDE